MPNTREKRIELLKETSIKAGSYGQQADYLIDRGITFATDNNVGHKWIPVTERLPEKDGIYLTFNKKGQYEFHMFQTGKSMWQGIWEEDGVIHWMPLPEPPKEA